MVNRSIASSLFTMSYNKTEGAERKNTDNSFSMFGNVLNEAVDKNLNASTDKKASFSQNANKSNNVNKENSYEKINSNHKTESKKDTVKTKSTSDTKELESSKELEKEKLIKKYLAENLGIDICDLELLLDKFKIDVMDIEGNLEAFNSLKEFLGLNSSEEKALLGIIGLAKEEVEKSETIVKEYLEGNKEKENWVKIQGFQVEIEEKPVNNNMEKLSLKIKESLKELSNKNTEKFSDKISQNPEKTLENINKTTVEKSEAKVKDDEILDAKGYDKYLESKKAASQKSDLNSNAESEMEEHLFHEKSETLDEKPKNLNHMEFRNLFSENIKSFNQLKETSIAQKAEAIPKREIAFQIVEKAKVLLSGDKSEMIMDLKPDHLGKLSLKLVTERGLVIAKFVAENEQVRAAIEANMDTLKESLEKQGFSVQEFSVSVNHNKNRQQDGYGENPKNLRESNTEDKGILTGNVVNTDIEMEIAKTNPYILNGSSINLTA
jgi:flagellar hook-length control protein FliK